MRSLNDLFAQSLKQLLYASVGILLVGAFLCMYSVDIFAASSESGPFCWAGKTDDGQEKFIPCHPRTGETTVRLDASFERLRIIIGLRTITVSREQVLKALEGWEAESRAKPRSPR